MKYVLRHVREKKDKLWRRVELESISMGGPMDISHLQRFKTRGSLSPLLFNLVCDNLTAVMDRARVARTVRGLVPDLILGGLTHLQYADNTIILLELEDRSIQNAKFLL